MSSPIPRRHHPFISMYTAVILLIATVIELVIGGLTFLLDFSAPGAVWAGLGTGGSACRCCAHGSHINAVKTVCRN